MYWIISRYTHGLKTILIYLSNCSPRSGAGKWAPTCPNRCEHWRWNSLNTEAPRPWHRLIIYRQKPLPWWLLQERQITHHKGNEQSHPHFKCAHDYLSMFSLYCSMGIKIIDACTVAQKYIKYKQINFFLAKPARQNCLYKLRNACYTRSQYKIIS